METAGQKLHMTPVTELTISALVIPTITSLSMTIARLVLQCGVLYFTRSGYVGPTNGAVVTLGDHSNYWLTTSAIADVFAYYLNFDRTDAQPSFYYTRWLGFSVRCQAS